MKLARSPGTLPKQLKSAAKSEFPNLAVMSRIVLK
jgi:hypothetical protein